MWSLRASLPPPQKKNLGNYMPVSVLPPLLVSHLRLYIAVVRRSSGRRLGTLGNGGTLDVKVLWQASENRREFNCPVFVLCGRCCFFTLDAGLLARSQ